MRERTKFYLPSRRNFASFVLIAKMAGEPFYGAMVDEEYGRGLRCQVGFLANKGTDKWRPFATTG